MWAPAAPLPYYSAYKSQPQQKRRPGKKDAKKDARKEATSSGSSLLGPPSPAFRTQHASKDIVDLLGPAVDGPPSPERIRALNQQMRRRASVLDKHRSQSSGSGSAPSLNSDRPSWEQTLEQIALSRRSSTRSTNSSMPSRDRPESLQLFGRTIFNRRGKSKRESSSHSSSGSSLYSTDMALDGPPTPSVTVKEAFVPALFTRRKTAPKPEPIGEEPVTGHRRPQISGPYNFQHVTHARRDQLANVQRPHRMESIQDASTLQAVQRDPHGTLGGNFTDDAQSPDYAYEATDVFPEEYIDPHMQMLMEQSLGPPRPAPAPPVSFSRLANAPGPRRLVKHSRSQEQLRTSPPRVLQSTAEAAALPPVPPPRISSRLSIRYDGFDPLETTTLERPATSGGFRQPQPFSPDTESFDRRPPATSHGLVPRSSGIVEEHETDFSHAITTPDDAAWPLSSASNFTFETVLADVPEEEEHYILSRRSRASLRSTNSSLRGSQSVPLLRQLARSQSPGPQRPPSGASDTLGRLDMFAAKRALLARTEDAILAESLPRDSWEDAIDYCYEHEADADFDYAWERPSVELTRDDSRTPEAVDNATLVVGRMHVGTRLSPHLSTPSHYDVPALSPASQTSVVTQNEAITPTASTMMTTASNYAFHRQDARLVQQRPASPRRASHASSFKESHGFDLSPSLLIPNDFRHQMALDEDEAAHDEHEYGSQLPARHQPPSSFEEEATLTFERVQAAGQMAINQRSSASTTGSRSSDETESSQRHASGASTWTAVTRMTESVGSLSQAEAKGLVKTASEPDAMPLSAKSPLSPFAESSRERPTAASPPPNVTSAFDEDEPPSGLFRARSGSGSDRPPRSPKLVKTRRQRARTGSLSAPPPPPSPGHYTVFPPTYGFAGARF